jgi:phage gp36-like protein
MAYCTQADILAQLAETTLVQLTDDNDVGIVDTDVVARAIADADEEIDGYCGGRYTVPFSPVPGIVRKASVDIAVYNLYSRRKGAPEDRVTRYNNTIRLLKDVSRGVVTLGADAPSATNTEHGVDFTGGTRRFSRDTLKGF